jgi:hypothetical protein
MGPPQRDAKRDRKKAYCNRGERYDRAKRSQFPIARDSSSEAD